MREESHHHLIFQNSYVNVLFVEIPAHESTLPHHHDLPYVSIQPGGDDAMPGATGSPRIGYSAGSFSHTVTNSADITLKNIAVELVRPQGTVRNRCAAIIQDQTPAVCQDGLANAAHSAKRTPLLESDEILVESWEFAPGTTTQPLNDAQDMLIGGLIGVRVTGASGIDSANALRGGVLWVPAGSKPVFEASSGRGGQFVSITFKDSGTAR